MRPIIKNILMAQFLILILGCGTSKNSDFKNQIIRQAETVPKSFLPPEGISLDQNSCKSPMFDPVDGTQIIMVTAQDGKGDYKVPEGKYGVQKGELLRLNCATGEVLGIVKD